MLLLLLNAVPLLLAAAPLAPLLLFISLRLSFTHEGRRNFASQGRRRRASCNAAKSFDCLGPIDRSKQHRSQPFPFAARQDGVRLLQRPPLQAQQDGQRRRRRRSPRRRRATRPPPAKPPAAAAAAAAAQAADAEKPNPYLSHLPTAQQYTNGNASASSSAASNPVDGFVRRQVTGKQVRAVLEGDVNPFSSPSSASSARSRSASATRTSSPSARSSPSTRRSTSSTRSSTAARPWS